MGRVRLWAGEAGSVGGVASSGVVGWGPDRRCTASCILQGQGNLGKYDEGGQLIGHVFACLGLTRG